MAGAETIRYSTIDGLDACGKDTLLDRLRERSGVNTVYAPPKSWRDLRIRFDKMDLRLRFLFYSMGNLAADNMVRRLFDKDRKVKVIQNRSWLSTLSAHQLRGLSPKWLSLGVYFAERNVRPDLSLIVHVDEEARRRRLVQRGGITRADRQNLQFSDKMELYYQAWAGRLGWSTFFFDNTIYEIDQAAFKLSEILGL